MSGMDLDLEKLTGEVKRVAVEAGRFLREERLSFDPSRVEQKAAHDYVSYVDKESERRIVARLRELLPEAGFVTEDLADGAVARRTSEVGDWVAARISEEK